MNIKKKINLLPALVFFGVGLALGLRTFLRCVEAQEEPSQSGIDQDPEDDEDDFDTGPDSWCC